MREPYSPPELVRDETMVMRSSLTRWKMSSTSMLVRLSGFRRRRGCRIVQQRARWRRLLLATDSCWDDARRDPATRPRRAPSRAAGFPPADRQSCAAAAELHVFDRGRARQQIGPWNTNPICRLRPDSSSWETRETCGRQQIASARRAIEAAQDVHERRFSRTGRADDGDELAAADVERDAAERVHRCALHGVDLRDVVGGDERRVGRSADFAARSTFPVQAHSVLRWVEGAVAGPFLPAKL